MPQSSLILSSIALTLVAVFTPELRLLPFQCHVKELCSVIYGIMNILHVCRFARVSFHLHTSLQRQPNEF